MARNWLFVNAAAEGLQKRTEMMERWQNQKVQVKEGRWAEEIPALWKQPKGEDRTEMQKEVKVYFGERISVGYREEVREKIPRKMRYLLWV